MNKIKVFEKYANEFLKTFNKSLDGFWNDLMGFEIVVFHVFIHPAAHERLGEATQRQYGERAVKLIGNILVTEVL